jgi:hypothetical protein
MKLSLTNFPTLDKMCARWRAHSTYRKAHDFDSTAGRPLEMADQTVVNNQKQILKNQKEILSNQRQIKANQETIKKNQASILKNQNSLNTIVKNQQQILALLKK